MEQGTGAIIEPQNDMIATFGEVVADSPTFDWVKGYDIREKLGKDLTTKDQDGSFSCGGQASSYLMEAILALKGTKEERSAKSIYMQCFVYPGGSASFGLMDTIINKGFTKESEISSYENGNPPSEEYMQAKIDLPSGLIRGTRPIYVDIDFESIAQAILQNGGVVIGLQGENNGTWLAKYPQIPSAQPKTPGLWNHWMYAGVAKIIEQNGRKMLGLKQSWGNEVGDNGWQFFGEEWLPYFWSCWSIMLKPLNEKPKVNFKNTLKYGGKSSDIKKLQDVLRYEGLFKNVSTGFYGDLTCGAVLKFQKKYKIASDRELDSLHGKVVGPKTLLKLNQLYA